jgi:tRNA(adenine34) deaminase
MPSFLDKLRAPWSKPVAPTAPVSELDLSMMRRALALAQAAAAIGEVPVGAVVYRTTTGEVLAEAHNRRESDKDPSAHAEHMAMVAASRALKDWRLTGCSLAVTLEPCPMCAGLIVNSRIDRVIYGAKDPKAGAMGSLMSLTEDPRLNHRVIPIAGVLADESAALLKDFFRKIRSQK